MDQPLFWAYVAAVVGALGGGIVLMVRKHRSTGLGLVLVGSFLVLLPVGLVAWEASPLSDSPHIQVEPLDPANEPYFTAELRHSEPFDDGIEVWLMAEGGPDHVAAVFQEQHPEGVVVAGDGNGETEPRLIWQLSTDDVRYDLRHGADSDGYSLETQLIVVSPEDGGPGARIPFPRTALRVTKATESEPLADNWTREEWAEFYSGIGDARVGGDTITVPTNRDYTATITLTDEGAVVTLND